MWFLEENGGLASWKAFPYLDSALRNPGLLGNGSHLLPLLFGLFPGEHVIGTPQVIYERIDHLQVTSGLCSARWGYQSNRNL